MKRVLGLKDRIFKREWVLEIGETSVDWGKLGVCGAQSRSSTPIIKLLIVILLAKNDNHLVSQNTRHPLDNHKKLCYNIYNEKYAFAGSRLLSLSIGENFLSQLKYLQPQFI